MLVFVLFLQFIILDLSIVTMLYGAGLKVTDEL
jgi:hypothetical protein